MQRAFSLVELSIVLVILGLLTGGILAGQSLIRASELRGATSEYGRWMTANHAFRDKYIAWPGDITNATAFWGKDAANCNSAAGAVGTPGTCNGNGNGQITIGGSPEPTRYWQHLALAGLIEGTYTGIPAAGGPYDMIPGTTVPRSKLSNTGWSVSYVMNYGSAQDYLLDYYSHYYLGAYGVNNFTAYSGIIPEDAWNIDTKLDDGKPASGKVVARNWNDFCARADDGTHANNDYVASYKLNSTSVACVLIFRNIF